MSEVCSRRSELTQSLATQQIMSSSLLLSSDVRMARGSGNSDHCSDSGGTSTPEVGMGESGFEMGVGVGEGGEEGMV